MSALLTYEQAADYLAIEVRTLRQWRAERKIQCVEISRKAVRFRKEDLDRFISKHLKPAWED